MKVNKEIRRASQALLKASFTDDQFDRGRISSLVKSLLEKRPRGFLKILNEYKRLLRLELEKRHARIESAAELDEQARNEILGNLRRKYGPDLTSEFVVTPELLGGMRIRVGSDVWDGTVRTRLQRLEQQF